MKEKVSGPIPDNGSVSCNYVISNNMARENLVKMKCSVCNSINHFTKRNKKKIKEKLELKKFCKKCRTNTVHKEMK